MKQKAEGISLLVALGASMLVMAMAMGIMSSVERSFMRSVDIENSLMFFYGSEAGIEAALFHKKARGRGSQFNCIDCIVEERQLGFYNNGMKTTWDLTARTDKYIGLMKEGEVLEIPLFWDGATSPSDIPVSVEPLNEERFLNTGTSLKFAIGMRVDSPDSPSPQNDLSSYFTDVEFIAKHGILENAAATIAYDTSRPEPFITWSLQGKTDSERLSLELDPFFNGVGDPVYCHTTETRSKFCPDFTGSIEQSFTDISDPTTPALSRVNGKIADDGDPEVFYHPSDMFQDSPKEPAGKDFTGTKEILLTISADTMDLEKSRGLPYVIQSDTEIPMPYYDITATVNAKKFNQRLVLKLKESVSNQSFKYVIFD